MATVNTHEAKTHLSELLRRVEEGEEIVIARNGKPIARLIPAAVEAQSPLPKRKLGTMKGSIILHPGWDDPMTDEELAEWYDAPLSTSDPDPEWFRDAATRSS